MKKGIVLITLMICAGQTFAQTLYKEVESRSGGTDLVGNFSPDRLKSEPFAEWFQTFYDYHEIDEAQLKKFEADLKQYHILVFMGTWCSDSQREIPALMKILEKAAFPPEQLKIIGVYDKGPFYKTSPNGEHWGLQIKMVPTIIFLKDGKEVNRIVESPVESLEKDIGKISSGAEYLPNYAELMRSEQP
ncbi:MAG: thioredoxin family protein [Flavobacteriaceae bacterium]